MKKRRIRKLVAVILVVVSVFSSAATALAFDNTLYWPLFGQIQQGNNSLKTTLVQRELYELGYFTSLSSVDGAFGSGTKTKVKSYQTNYSLTSDGIVGSNTWRSLEDRLTFYNQEWMGTGYYRVRFKVDGVYCVNVVVTDAGDGSTPIMYEWVVLDGSGTWRNMATTYTAAGTYLVFN